MERQWENARENLKNGSKRVVSAVQQNVFTTRLLKVKRIKRNVGGYKMDNAMRGFVLGTSIILAFFFPLFGLIIAVTQENWIGCYISIMIGLIPIGILILSSIGKIDLGPKVGYELK